jgi:hypothetical protein
MYKCLPAVRGMGAVTTPCSSGDNGCLGGPKISTGCFFLGSMGVYYVVVFCTSRKKAIFSVIDFFRVPAID